jgi:alkylation response protein AidB-like acyl-CoA dehydrogenase
MVVRTYAVESLLYRTAGLVDARIDATASQPSGGGALPGQDTAGAAAASAFEEYAVEASIAKVFGSEALNYVLDENIQIHGGNGFVKDYPAERHFRDARVNRIFEGTNEINRLLIPGMLVRRAVKGDLPLIAAAKALQDELLSPPSMPPSDEGVLADEHRAVDAFKKVALMVLGMAMQTFGAKLTDEQEVLMHAADILMEVFAAESAVLRAQAASGRAHAKAPLHVAAARVFVNDAALRIDASARQALAATVDGDALRMSLAALRRLMKFAPINTAALRRRLSEETVTRGGYPFA